MAILDLENDLDVAGELGPLEYLSGLTGTPMDKIINILLLVIIFVFDPLAISLVIAANYAFDMANRKNLYGEVESDIPDIFEDDPILDEDEYPPVFVPPVTGSKPDGVEFGEPIDLPDEARGVEPPDWKVVDENDKEIEDKKKVVRVLQKGPSKDRVLFSDGSSGWLTKKKDDDNKITYL